MAWMLTCSDWEAFLQRATHATVMAVAVKTTGPDPFLDQVSYLQLATEKEAVVVDVAALGGLPSIADSFSALLSSDRIVKAFHDAKTAIRFLIPSGLCVRRIFDSMLALQLLAAGRAISEPTLVEAASIELDLEVPLSPSLTLEEMRREVQAILALRSALIPKLVEAKLIRCAQLEFECSRVTAEIENAGLRLDSAGMHELSIRATQRMEEASQSFAATFGADNRNLFGSFTLNINSDKQLLHYLQEKGYPLKKVSSEALQPLLADHPELEAILTYRRANVERELEERYASYIHNATGRIHSTYTQIAAATGRFGCSNPNVQSLPRSPQVRSCVIPAPGKVFIMADYSQIELRIVAQITRDKTMLAAFERGQDLHRLTASIVTEKSAEQVTSAERQAAKAVNFGLVYAMGARRLAAYAQQQYGIPMTLEQAFLFRERYFRAYTGVQAWHAKAKRLRPTAVRTLSGRLREVPPNSLSAVLNTPVQGTGADILKQALIELSPAIAPLGGAIVAIVHDEIIVEVPRAQAEAAQVLVSRIMETAAESFLPDIPCPVDAVIGQSWAEKS